jgi:hypothetical protein
LLAKLAPLYEAWNAERVSKKTWQRKVGAGGKFHLDLEDRLVMLLIYYRCYITHAFLGFLFQIDDSNVSRNKWLSGSNGNGSSSQETSQEGTDLRAKRGKSSAFQ